MHATCPTPVDRPRILQRWDRLTFIHWEIEPADLAPLIPPPLHLDTFDGSAWVGLVPFEMQGVRPPWLATLGPFSRFCETNVRTYVVGPDGGRGVYFFSLDAADLAAVVTARALYRLPYHWSSMSITGGGRDRPGEVSYRLQRRGPGARGARSLATVSIGDPVRATALDIFLTARWGLYQVVDKAVRYTPVDHEPWPLCTASVAHLEDELVAAAGVPAPAERMFVRYSPGVDVRIGRQRRVA